MNGNRWLRANRTPNNPKKEEIWRYNNRFPDPYQELKLVPVEGDCVCRFKVVVEERLNGNATTKEIRRVYRDPESREKIGEQTYFTNRKSARRLAMDYMLGREEEFTIY